MGRLNWQNVAATLLTGVIVVIYVFFLEGTSLRLISTRGVIAVVLALGLGAWVLYVLDSEAQDQARRDFAGTATLIEGVTLIAAVIGLITGSMVALAILVAGTLALWLTAILRRATISRNRPGQLRAVRSDTSETRRKAS
jgi:uncharacterized membrane protein